MQPILEQVLCLSLVVAIGRSAPDDNYTKVCTGSASGLGHTHANNPGLRYEMYVAMFGNCTVVEKSVEIVFLDGPDDYDMSFLSSIREIKGYLLIYGNNFTSLPLTKLRLVRGLSLYAGSSVYVSTNPRLKEVQMPSIHEILEGSVHFETNANLCYTDTIEWRDIMSSTAGTVTVQTSPQCKECNSTCEFNGTKRCWGAGPNLCQKINRLTCSDGCTNGCFGPGPTQCCHASCVGGCTTSTKNCWACRHFNDTGACVDGCPPEKIYNRKTMKLEANPDVKYAYGTDCVKNCPNHMLVEDGCCVTTCQTGRLPNKYNHCVPCDNGVCPKICNGTGKGLHVGQLQNFINCTIIEGNLQIISSTFEGDRYNNRTGIQIEDLAVLETVQEITEFLYVDARSPNLTSLSFLKNLKVIHGRRLHGDATNSLIIHKTNVEDLGLSSLREIKHGIMYIENNQNLARLGLVSLEMVLGVGSRRTAIYIVNNTRLCYVHNFNFTGLFNPNKTVFIRDNSPKQECESRNETCSSRCTSDGCWGPGDDECRFCTDYRFGQRCLESCNATPGLYTDDVGKECRKCHDECLDTCHGDGSDNCTTCRHVKDGPYCVATCPDIKYPDEDGVCRECDSNCRNGCNGPKGFLGVGGCNDCDIVIEGTVECKPENHDCGDGFYRSPSTDVPINNGTIFKKTVCRRCDAQCRTCTGIGSHETVCKCRNYTHASHCVESCLDGYYGDANKNCKKCHAECKTCVGFGTHENICECLNYKHANYCVESCRDGFHGVKKVCKKCHAQCKTCQGFGPHEDVFCECINYKLDGNCVESCRDGFYHGENKVCQECDTECKRCFGPSPYNCTMCKKYRVYLRRAEFDSSSSYMNHSDEDYALNVDAPNVTGNFVCNNSCPDWASEPHTEGFGDEEQAVCKEPVRHIVSSSTGTGQGSENSIVGAVVVAVVCIVGAVVVLVAVLVRQRARAEENKYRLEAKIQGLNDEEILAPTDAKPDMSSLRLIKESELQRGHEIGSGAFGTVYKGIWSPEGEHVKVPVAIKVLIEGSNPGLNKELLDEARVMASVVNPCCIRILAVCQTKQMMLITPLVVHGCLLDFIRKEKEKLNSSCMLRWSAQIARGMNYLEQKGIVHRDLAARNILVQSLNQIKITDFGLAKLLNFEEVQYLATGGKMPIKWLALESIQHRIFTHKSDVWSYGVTLWELFTYGARPYEHIRAVNMADHLELGERLSQPSICSIDVYMIMIKCWMLDVDSRPTFQELETYFTAMARDPGRYLVIQGDKLMRMASCETEENMEELLRMVGSIADGSETFISADDYLSPQDMESRREPGTSHIRRMASVMEEDVLCPEYINSSFSGSNVENSLNDCMELSHLKAAAIAMQDGRSRKQSLRYFSTPCIDDDDEAYLKQAPSPPSEDLKKGFHFGGHDEKKVCVVNIDKDDYLEPQSVAAKYLEVVDGDDDMTSADPFIHKPILSIDNPEYLHKNPDKNSKQPSGSQSLYVNSCNDTNPVNIYYNDGPDKKRATVPYTNLKGEADSCV